MARETGVMKGDRALIQRLVRDHERRIHERPSAQELLAAFFAYHEAAVMNLRRVVDLVIVDVGGKAQPEKMGVRDRCTDGIIISRVPELVQEWREFCEPTLNLMAVIHSVLEARCEVVTDSPLEIVAGAWLRGRSHQVPEPLLQAVGRLVDSPVSELNLH
ncbi:MAG: hypothetical protein HC899_35105 [Leptolyngbyaceae cyanobacterium SM1_4_3]|nr:hypothetical protein [Leptolyngbyaceae cyanobacterium SM1_4_3]